MFGGTVWALTHGRPKDEKINWSMALVALMLMILSTIVGLRLCLIPEIDVMLLSSTW